MLSIHASNILYIVWMISWIITPPWKRKPLGRIIYPIWIANGGKWCIKGTWCVISKINILVLKIMNGTESSETNVSISKKCKKSSTSLSDAKVVQKNQHSWPTIKPFISSRHDTNIDIMLCENDSIISESETVAKIFNKYFYEIADGIGFNDPIPENFDKDDILASMIKRYDDHPRIVTIKKKFCPQRQTFDFVHITAYDVKSCIINTFPDLLKYAEIAALFKKLDRLCKENYRPVSILIALSKVFEKTYCRQLTSYFDRIFSKYLSGFSQKYSCQSTLLRMIEKWKSALNNGNMVGSIAIDLSRALDSLPHGLL